MDGSDAQLVVAAAGGDRDAFAELYDRYSAPVYDLCAHMLRNREEAADATAEVFIAAHGHLGQLRDPAKCKSWLYAIARNEVYKRTRQRGREQVVDMNDELFAAPVDDHDDTLDPEASARMLREAALGLDDRDRLVLELTLAGKLDGQALGDALGVSENGAHQAAHRMRDRLGRSIGALLVARQGRADCAELDALLAPWDGAFSVLWRKRVARHVDKCEVCDRRRRAVPAGLFSGTAFAATPIAFLAPPAGLRDRVFRQTANAPTSTRGFRRDGFPPKPTSRGRIAAIAGAIAVFLAIIALVVSLAGGSDGNEPASTTTTGVSSSTSSPTSTSRAPIVVPSTPSTTAPATTTTVPETTTTTPPTTAPVPTTTTTDFVIP